MTPSSPRRGLWWIALILLGAITVTAATVGVWQLQQKNRVIPPLADQPAQRQAVLDATRNGVEKVLSYTPETYDHDFSTAQALLTGDFLSYYTKFSTETVRPAAIGKKVTTRTVVQRIGVESMTAKDAAALTFIQQTTSSQEKPTPSVTVSTVDVGLVNVDGRWLISKFDPVA